MVDSLTSWLVTKEWVADRLADWLTDFLIDLSLSGYLTGIEWLTDSLTDSLVPESLTAQSKYWVMACLINFPKDELGAE